MLYFAALFMMKDISKETLFEDLKKACLPKTLTLLKLLTIKELMSFFADGLKPG
jgi:hypothetical protein